MNITNSIGLIVAKEKGFIKLLIHEAAICYWEIHKRFSKEIYFIDELSIFLINRRCEKNNNNVKKSKLVLTYAIIL